VYTDKKENEIFLIMEIQLGSGAKSYMTNRLLIYNGGEGEWGLFYTRSHPKKRSLLREGV
jgi:hypothetical protein